MKLSLRILVMLVGVCYLTGSASAQPPTGKLTGAGAPPSATNSGAVVVKVNGEPITAAEVDAVIHMSQRPTTTPLTEAQKKEVQATAINLLVEDTLMRQYLRQHVAPANMAEVDNELKELTATLAKNDKKTLADFLRETGQTEAQLRADLAARQQWKNFITPKLTDAAVKQYYDTNKPFFDKVLVRASHILLKVAPDAKQADRQLVYNRILTIRQDILSGKIKFEDAAKTKSECPSKDNGGDIGLFPYKFAVLAPFANAAFSMKIGDISEVVATDFGYHIIKVTDRTNGQPSNFESIKTEVKEIYSQEVYQYIITEQRKTAKIETK